MITVKSRGRYESPVYPLPPQVRSLPSINVQHQNSTFVTIEKRILAHGHPKSVIYMRVHSWFYVFSGFGQMCSDTYPSLRCHTEWFQRPEKPLCSTCSCLRPPTPSNH